jgi:hypothetical protein
MKRRPDSTHEIRADRGNRPKVRCACDRNDMDYKAARCWECRNERRRKYWREYEQLQKMPVTDFTPAQIRDRYIRAVWQSNPAKAQRLLAQMRAA